MTTPFANRFDTVIVAEDRPVISLEDVYRFMAAFGGVHDTTFNSTVSGVAATGVSGVTWSVGTGSWDHDVDGYLAPQSYGEEAFAVFWCSEDMPSSFAFEVCGHGDGVAVAVRGTTADYYLISLTNDYGLQFYHVAEGVGTLLNSNFEDIHSEDTVYGYGRIKFAVKDTVLTTNNADRWLFLSVWQDDAFIGTHAINIPEADPGFKLGLAAADDSVTYLYGSVRVPDLFDIIPFATIDPAETPWGGIQRAIADKVVENFMRYDGTLTAFRSKARARDRSYVNSGMKNLTVDIDSRNIFTRLRLNYALDWVEVFDEDLYEAYGHKFEEITSQVIENLDEAELEALAMLRRVKENIRFAGLETLMGGPFIEPQDRVLMPDGEDYFVNGYSWRLEGNRMGMSIEGRHYVFA